MYVRIALTSLLFSAMAMAGSRPVCPGPASKNSAHCHAHVGTDVEGNPHATTGPTGITPAQFRTAYGLTATGSSATTIAIVDAYDDPNIEADLQVFSQKFGLPACTTANGCFKKVNQTGGTKYPAKNAGWSLEIALDVETAHAICPACKILLVEATTNSFANLLTAEDYAIAHAKVVSNSWGGDEFSGETAANSDGHFNHPGKAITFSSGDAGYGVEYPASSQYVTAVGGTTLTINKTTGAYVSEKAWAGAGSGCSAYEPKPSWQKDGKCVRRTVADVSADADPNTGAAVYDSVVYQGRSGWFQVGGTSLSSPLIAAVYALGTKTNTNPANIIYNNLGSLHDVTTGTNGTCGGTYLCTARTGYDGPTGNGTPKGTNAF